MIEDVFGYSDSRGAEAALSKADLGTAGDATHQALL
jgi:hypothetical protein